jgi:hypothetical protein
MRSIPDPKTTEPQSMRALFSGLIDPKATEYHGVVMRSRLEAAFAAHLDAMGVRWRYEPRIYGPSGEGYLPDFEIIRADGSVCFVEVKPTRAEVRAAAKRMEIVWKDEPRAVLMVACAQGCEFYVAAGGSHWASFVERWRH